MVDDAWDNCSSNITDEETQKYYIEAVDSANRAFSSNALAVEICDTMNTRNVLLGLKF